MSAVPLMWFRVRGVVSAFRACGSLLRRGIVRRDALYAPPVPYDDEAQGALTQNPNGNATRFVTMAEIFLGECPDTKGAAPDAARQPDSGLEGTACASGSEATKPHTKGWGR